MKREKIQVVAVLGAGTMGAQIVYECALHGYRVHMADNVPAALDSAHRKQQEWADQEIRDVESRKAVIAQITAHASLEEAVADADLVIECLPEDLGLKQRVFAQLDRCCSPEVILASNSSSLRMSRIETEVRHRERVCNMHFFQRSHRMIEIMAGSITAPAIMEKATRFAVSLDLFPLVLKRESTGFLYNRIWRAVKREVLHEVAEGVANPEDIDRVIMMLWRWEKGPFAYMDQVGLDVVRDIELVYFEESREARDKPPAFLDQMITRGELGVKTGKGFYTYPNPLYQQPGWLPSATPAPVAQKPNFTRDDFIGAWRLAKFEATTQGQTTYPFGSDAIGCLTYSSAGRMSVLISRAQRERFAAQDPSLGTLEERAAGFDGCFAYAGTFEVSGDRVIHRLEQCTFPNWIGTEQVRFFRFEGNRLTLETPLQPMYGKQTVSRLTWERF